GLAAAELRHRVEQMSKPAQPFGDGELDLVIRGGGVTGGNHDAALDERTNGAGRSRLRRESDQSAAAMQRRKEVDRLGTQNFELRSIVSALPGRVQERPLDVNAEHAGNALGDRRIDRFDRAANDLEIVTDQRRQKPRGSESTVRLPDRRDAGNGRMIVEQYSAAAVHLQVDEARHELAVERSARNTVRALARWEHINDKAIVHHDAAILAKPV